MADFHPDVIRAINHIAKTPLGRKYDRMARRRYGISGKKLAAKEVQGESGFRGDAVSSAGARGYTQFMPATRAEYLRRYGVDAYHGPRSAVRAMELYQTAGNGIESYNPGMPTYASYILGQKLSAADKRALGSGNRRRSAGRGTRRKRGTFALRTPQRTSVGLEKYTIPGQSFEAERKAAADQLFLSGRPLTMASLLNYKATVDSLKDVPARRVSGDLVVQRSGGKPMKVPTRPTHNGTADARNPVQHHRGIVPVVAGKHNLIGYPHQGTHTLGNWQSDNAIDIAMPVGTPIRVPRDAVVEKVAGSYNGGASRFDGYQITVRLSTGRQLFFTHLSHAFVKPGQKLSAGQRIGRSGAANGVPHLHLGASAGNPQRFD